MPNISLNISGIDQTVRRIQSIGGSAATSLMKGAVYLRGVFATYPPQRPGSRYIRTHNLGHRWTVARESETRVRIGNNAPYARYVMDEDVQPPFMRRAGWKPVQQITREQRARVIEIVKADFKAQLRKR